MNNTIVVIESGWIMVGEMTNPYLVFKPIEIRVRRCQECDSIITGLNIVIVKNDDKRVGFDALSHGIEETELFEAINCEHCGHQNIIGKYYRHASDDIQLKAQIARKDSKKDEVTLNQTAQTTLLKNAFVVRRWNNGKGIGGLAKAENKHEYTLDPVGSVSIQTSKILFEIPCEW